jgi:HSP20 family protein
VHTLLIESDDSFILIAEVPGYGAEDLAIRIEPRSVTIAGQRKAVGQRTGRKVLQGDHCADQLLRILPLSAEVDASQTAVLVRDGILELEIPKASPDLGAPNEIHSYSVVLAEDYNRWTYALVQLPDSRL